MIEVLDNSKDGIYNSNMELVDSFTDYSSKNLDFDKPVTIELMDDEENAKNPLGTTAHYNPDEMKITIYVTGRHIKDILRSISHELIHHVQNCRGDLSGMQDTSLGYAQRDKHMRDMETEAFNSGNIMNFRDFEDNYKQRNRKMSKLQENRLRRLNQILMGDNKKLLKEQEALNAIRILPSLFEKGASLNKIQNVLVRALGTGTRPNDPVVQNLMRQFGNLRKAGRLTANAGMSAIERATGRSLAGAAVRTGTQIVATKTGQKITQELVKRQAGREIIKRAAAGALARGAGRMAAGQAIGSAVPGFGNFVMAAIIGAGVVGDLMLIYYEREKLRMKGATAGRNVRKKCKTLREKGFPVEEGTPEEYKELAKDFANAIAFSPSYLKLSSYRKCLRKLMSMPKGESYLRDAGISFDVVSPSDVGLSQEDIGGSQLVPGMTTIGGQSIGGDAAYGTGQAIGGRSGSRGAPSGRTKYRKCTKNFKKGCKGDNITTIQGLLYLNLKDTFLKGVKREDFVDGKFWTATDKAVRAFQKANKLGVDGVVGKNTLEKLTQNQVIANLTKRLGAKTVAAALKKGEDVAKAAPKGAAGPFGAVPPAAVPMGGLPKMTARQAVDTAKNMMRGRDRRFMRTAANLAGRAVYYLIDKKGMSPEGAYAKTAEIFGPEGEKVKLGPVSRRAWLKGFIDQLDPNLVSLSQLPELPAE